MTRKLFWRMRKKVPSARNLTSLALDDVRSILDSADIAKEWAAYAPRLSELCQIEDGKTGGVNPGDRRALFYLVRAFRPARMLEIGTHVGASTLYIVAALMRGGWKQIPRLVTVDIEDVNDSPHSCWRQVGLPKSPKQMVEELNATVEITFVTDDSRHFFATTKETFDFIFLDGDHAAETVYEDIVGSLDVINKNGLIVLHDYFQAAARFGRTARGFAVPSPPPRKCARPALPSRSFRWDRCLGQPNSVPMSRRLR